VSMNGQALRRFAAFVVPPPESLALAHDKLEAQTVAHRVGIATPRTFCPEDGELDALAQTLQYPCVLKLRKGAGAVGMGFAQTPTDLLRLYRSLPDQSDLIYDRRRPIVQEVVPGGVHDVCLLFNRGEPRAASTQRRLIMCPPEGGPGIYVETTDEPDLRDAAIALLEALDWHGPAQVEFKRDTRDGTPKLIDINTRFWGTLDVAIQAGVNFPLLTCRIALEGNVKAIQSYKVGLRYRWPFPHGWRHARQQEHRWRSLWRFLKPQRNTCSDLRLFDLRPHLAEAYFRYGNAPTAGQPRAWYDVQPWQQR